VHLLDHGVPLMQHVWEKSWIMILNIFFPPS
jgi:hypothetical protein